MNAKVRMNSKIILTRLTLSPVPKDVSKSANPKMLHTCDILAADIAVTYQYFRIGISGNDEESKNACW